MQFTENLHVNCSRIEEVCCHKVNWSSEIFVENWILIICWLIPWLEGIFIALFDNLFSCSDVALTNITLVKPDPDRDCDCVSPPGGVSWLWLWQWLWQWQWQWLWLWLLLLLWLWLWLWLWLCLPQVEIVSSNSGNSSYYGEAPTSSLGLYTSIGTQHGRFSLCCALCTVHCTLNIMCLLGVPYPTVHYTQYSVHLSFCTLRGVIEAQFDFSNFFRIANSSSHNSKTFG